MEKLVFIIAALAVCPVSSLTERQYHFISELKTWTDAQSYCRQNYGDLVTARSKEDVDKLNSLATLDKDLLKTMKYAWIGLYDAVNSWRWSMSDKVSDTPKEAEFTNWLTGQPDVNGGQYCVMMASDGKWHNVDCNANHTLICSDSEGQSQKFVNISIVMKWAEAQSYCRKHHTDLATVTSMEDNNVVQRMAEVTTGVWIGLFREGWKWSDGCNSTFSNWEAGHPSGQGVACAAAAYSQIPGEWAKWNDKLCSEKLPFLCYKDVVPVSKQVVKLQTRSSVDLSDPAAQEDLMKKLKQNLQDNGVSGDIKLSWRKKADGKIFRKKEKEDQE